MPEISRFLGIVIRMYFADHAPPHFHAEYGDYEILVEIETGVVNGRFPPRALKNMNVMAQFLHVTKAEYVSGFQVHLEFNNGDAGVIDLQDALYGPIFEPLRNPVVFSRFRIEGHTLSWPNGADFAPEFLHDLLQR